MGVPLRVFEHQSLYLNDKFRQTHWKALAAYNERHGSKYFTLLPDGVRFTQYVGVVQAGDLTIEILPKIQRLDSSEEEDKKRWRTVLLHMLHECRFIRVAHPERAALALYSGSLLDAYLQLFLEEVQRLLYEGLSKHYRKVEGNRNALKGRLQFAPHIRQNLVHGERFYVQHTAYDGEHLLHQVLYKALGVVNRLATRPVIKSLAGRLLLDFPPMPDLRVSAETFKRLKLSRKEDRYAEAVLIAKMLLLQYRPDIQSGEEQVLALLFDMNRLWEEYVYRQLLKLEGKEFSVERQQSEGFWHLTPNSAAPRTVRPDLIVRHQDTQIVVDTKWKLLETNEPADDDLKQMFTYAHYFDSTSLLLLYPSLTKEKISGKFVRQHTIGSALKDVECSVLKVPVLYEEEIRLDICPADF